MNDLIQIAFDKTEKDPACIFIGRPAKEPQQQPEIIKILFGQDAEIIYDLLINPDHKNISSQIIDRLQAEKKKYNTIDQKWNNGFYSGIELATEIIKEYTQEGNKNE